MTKLMAIINLTPDSFSNDGFLNSNIKFVDYLNKAKDNSINIIDIGAESTRPRSEVIDYKEELRRIKIFWPAIKEFHNNNLFEISIDTYNIETMKWVLDQGVNYINDVSGGDIEKYKLISKYKDVKYICMHNTGIPILKTIREDVDIIDYLLSFFSKKLSEMLSNDIDKDQIIFDPGIGFGTTPNQSVDIIKRCKELKESGFPILIGHSRKSFIRKYFRNCDFESLDIETLAISSFIINNEIDYIRIHNFELHSRFLNIISELKNV